MKKISVLVLIIILSLSSCSFDVQVVTPGASQPSPEAVTQSAETPVATVSLIAATPVVGFTPVTSEPVFYGAYISDVQGGEQGHSAFPAGTKQLFAHWHYQNMREGLTITRKWTLNGEPWLTREEAWDQAKYGASGILQDVSIQDFEAGLSSGVFQLRVYIDDVLQPIGVVFNGQPETWIRFEIYPNESETGVASPDNLWSAFILNGSQLMARDLNGTRIELHTGNHINSLAWLPDSRHLLFLDRDPLGPPIGPAGSRPGELWIVDVQSREVRSLYKSDTALGDAGGLMVSPDGHYVAGLEGSGYGDACFLDAQMIFFEIGIEYQNVKAIKQNQFAGIPTAANGMMYPPMIGSWQSNTQFRLALNATCDIDQALSGFYVFDLAAVKATRETTPLAMGDLGWGKVHGIVTDAATSQPIVGATVTCEQSSYGTQIKCAGSVLTEALGVYIFQNVFFHDTDTIKLTVTAPGYQSQEFTQSAFQLADMERNFSLNKAQ